jgi:hypothetical protein
MCSVRIAHGFFVLYSVALWKFLIQTSRILQMWEVTRLSWRKGPFIQRNYVQ